MGFTKPIEQYLFSDLLIKIQVFMYLKYIIREVSGKFLRPGQGHAKNISAKDLDTHDQRHGDQEKNKDKFFEVLVQPVKYFFHEGPPLKIEYRYFFTNNCLTLYSYKNYRYFYFK